MDPKKALTNGVFCPMPWTGLMYNFDGTVKNCIRSAGTIGNIKDDNIEKILHGPVNLDTQSSMLNDMPGKDCHTCYSLEDGKKKFDIISDRIFYIRELKTIPFDTYQLDKHDLHTIDVRWTNLCNFACVYCSPEFSSKWASELGVYPQGPSEEQVENFKSYILSHAEKLKHVYMAGGEPLLMKENRGLLELLLEKNPDVSLRINTNLSKVDTGVFEMICQFKNVHWTVSVESMGEEFEYIRFGGKWNEFLENLTQIQRPGHKITFNMLYFLLNYESMFDCIDFLTGLGFHNNGFVIGPVSQPSYLNIRHLPDDVLNSLKSKIRSRIDQKPGFLLQDSLENLLRYLEQPFQKNLHGSLDRLNTLDQRRGLDSKKIFKKLYSLA